MDPLLFNQTNFLKSNWWKLKINTLGYKDQNGNNLVTEIAKDRYFRFIDSHVKRKNNEIKSRYFVQLFEDGYLCWIDINGLNIEKCDNYPKQLFIYNEILIKKKMPSILNWICLQSKKINHYKWGGTLGPGFDCSGMIQTAFMQNGIYIPRDSYQLMSFCRHLCKFPGNSISLEMGDLLFFGDNNRCNHVAIYFKNGKYYHCSGKEFGRDGISTESLYESENDDTVSRHYRSKLICAGRVYRSIQWDKTLR